MIIVAAASWIATLDGHINQDLRTTDVHGALERRPIVEFDRRVGRNLPVWHDWINHVVRDHYGNDSLARNGCWLAASSCSTWADGTTTV